MPAGSTYTPIATTTIGTAVSSYTFSSISSAYTDLVLVGSLYSTTNDVGVYAQFNGDTATNYSSTLVLGTGSAAQSARFSNVNYALVTGYNAGIASTTNVFAPAIMNIQNYSNTTTNKTVVTRSASRNNGGDGDVMAITSLWRSTAAINSIKIYYSSGNLAVGTTLTLYGIASA